MTRLIPGCTLVGLMLTLLPAPTSAAGSNTATTLFPVDEVTQLETHTFLDCHPNGSATSSLEQICAHPTARRAFRPGCGRAKPPRSVRRTGWPIWTRTPPASSNG
ncbi:putative secreted protein [Mycobacterium tuberculosis]|nr:putative secreted protein [Mycobacterium tuberculosis]